MIQGPKMNWTEDEGLHKRYTDWREEVELIMATSLKKSKYGVKAKYIILWAGREACTHLNNKNDLNQTKLKDIPEAPDKRTKSKGDKIAAFIKLHTLTQCS